VLNVKVSLVGRMAFVEHSSDTPPLLLVDRLNDLKLGASLQTSGVETAVVEKGSLREVAFPCVLTLLLALGVFADAEEHNALVEFLAWVLEILAVLLGGIPVLLKGIRSLRFRQLDINCLMSIAIVGAVILGQVSDAALVVTLLAWAAFVEETSMRRVRNALQASATTAVPQHAVKADGEQVLVKNLLVGDIICVRSGEQIPVDGEVVKGDLCVDESLLTGEATPIRKGKGATVLGGTLATEGYAEVRATAGYGDSTLAGIADLVAEAGATQSHTQQALDAVIAWYVPCILLLAGALAFAVPFALSEPCTLWAQRALVLLVSACPCALTLAGVVPGVTGIATAAKHGAIIKSCDILDRLGDVQCCAFDKTGTLTEGRFAVTTSRLAIAREGRQWSIEEIKHLAASLESKSSHPLAAAVVADVVTCVVDAHEKLGA
jgi:Cd2+/Zn2+-exporting ATPase